MCGIAGIISFKNRIDAKYINRMTDIISYRGPDDEGALLLSDDNKIKTFKRAEELNAEEREGKILLGHRRLSIIDLTLNGHQPMSYDNANLWITYNGEIYNYIELKEELCNCGYSFRTKTDTEVILASYHKWGKECVYKFNGMWAFAILDLRNNIIFCSTDQFAIKPFYYYIDDDGFYFSSELKQLLELPWINKQLNREYLMNIFGYMKHSEYFNITLINGIMQLNAGYNIILKNVLSLEPDFKIEKWHEFNTKPIRNHLSEKEAIKKFDELFYDSVKIRLRSDVPIGTALSGGIDSSAIVVTMDKLLKESGSPYIQKTFTAGSEISDIDETNFAKEILRNTDAIGYFTTPTADGFIAELEKMYYHNEMPFDSTSCYASWCVYKLAKEAGVAVTLDGQGADEILAGYDIYMYPYYQAEFLVHGKFKQLFPNYKYIKENYHESFFKQLKEIIIKNIKTNKTIKNKYEYFRLRDDKLFAKEFIDTGKSLLHNGKSRYLFDNKYSIFLDSFSNYLRNTFYTITLPLLLRVVDRNSMAHSIEARVPFLDYRLVEFVYTLPHTFKIKKGITKYLLRESFKNQLSKNCLSRIKLGFVTAEQEWISSKKSDIISYIYNNIVNIKEIFNASYIQNLSNNHSETSDRQNLWKLLSLSVLIKNFNLKL